MIESPLSAVITWMTYGVVGGATGFGVALAVLIGRDYMKMKIEDARHRDALSVYSRHALGDWEWGPIAVFWIGTALVMGLSAVIISVFAIGVVEMWGDLS